MCSKKKPSLGRPSEKCLYEGLEMFLILIFLFKFTSVVDPDPYPDPDWIRIQWGPWIRIRIGIRNPRTKITYQTKIEKVNKYYFLKCLMSLLRAEGFSCSLDVLYGGLGISELQFQLYFFLLKFLFVKILDLDWIRIHLKCWIWICIRIRIQ
jgi:hypothetical protein